VALPLKLSRMLDDDVAELVGASCVIYLLRNAEGSTAISTLPVQRDYARHWTPVHMDFVVDDVQQAAQRAVDAGATRESDCVQWRGSRCITLSDPFGHGFCVIEFENETYEDGPAQGGGTPYPTILP
jgi:hypothetical protein